MEAHAAGMETVISYGFSQEFSENNKNEKNLLASCYSQIPEKLF